MSNEVFSKQITEYVLGWKYSIGNRCYQTPEGEERFDFQKPYVSFQWCRQIIEAMNKKDFVMTARQLKPGGRWFVRFGYMGKDTLYVDADVTAKDFPHAVFRAALKAMKAYAKNLAISTKEYTKVEAYRLGYYVFPAVPVCSMNWDEKSWINYIDSTGQWTVKIKEEECKQ